MSSIENKIREDLIIARKNKDKDRILVLSSVIGDLSNAKINNSNEDLTEDKAINVVMKAVKQRKDSAEEYDKVGSVDRRDKELAEADVLSNYLPAEANEDDMKSAIDEVIGNQKDLTMRDIGKIMSSIRKILVDKGLIVDGGKLSALVKNRILGK